MTSYHHNNEYYLILAIDKKVIMVNIPEGRVLYQYEHVKDEIKCIAASHDENDNPCFWIGTQDAQLLCLDSELKVTSTFKLSESILSLSVNQSVGLFAIGMKTRIMIRSVLDGDKDMEFPAHVDGVKQLGWHHTLLLSLGHLDHTISMWSIREGKKGPKLIASLNCKQPINYFHNKQGIVIAGCADGTLSVFDITLLGEIQMAGGGGSKTKSALILDPLQIAFVKESKDDESGKKVTKIPILTASITNTDTGPSIMTTRGNVLKPEFETISMPSQDTILHRTLNDDQLLFNKSSIKSGSRHTATVIWEREVDFVRGNNLLYDQIQGEDMLCDDLIQTIVPEEGMEGQKEGLSASILIEQALKSGDKEVLDQALSIKSHLIPTTIRSIAASSVFPFLEALVMRFLKCKQGRIPVLVPWYQNLLLIHGDILRTDVKRYKLTISPLMDMMDEYVKGMRDVEEALRGVEGALEGMREGQRHPHSTEHLTPVIVFNDEL